MKRWLSSVFVAALVVGGYAQAQDYVTDDLCGLCHGDIADSYMNSGHPWKLHHTHGQTPPVDEWPWSDVKTAAGIPPVPPLPVAGGEQLGWSDVEFVIGNFFWKARFIRPDGFIYIGDAGEKTQWNLATQEFVPYHAGEPDKPYNCGRCHTTGYQPDGNQTPILPIGTDHDEPLPGLVGTWVQDGVRCEACHGPASDHIQAAFAGNGGNVPPPGGKDCRECHYRDAPLNGRMPWKGGFMRHHQQAEDMDHSPHAELHCNTCHNPHRSTVYNDGGISAYEEGVSKDKLCTDCHDDKPYEVAGMESVNCIECHMPDMGKSAVAVNPYKGDVRGHLFQIMTDPIAAADNVVDADGNLTGGAPGFWKQDANGQAFVTVDYACLGCHTGMPLDVAAGIANGIHEPPNVPPTADPNGPYTGTTGQAVAFDGSGSTDTDGTIVSYDWDFGDGNTGTGVNPTHTYAAAGQYTVTLTVTDDGGDTDTTATTADITDTPPLPPGDTWVLDIPFRYMYDQAIVTFTPYVSILVRVETMFPDGTIVRGMGFEVRGMVYWWNYNPYSVFYGRINRDAGTMSGIVISRQGVGIWSGGQP